MLFNPLGSANCKEMATKTGTYIAAKRMARFAPVVSLAQICEGGNHNAF